MTAIRWKKRTKFLLIVILLACACVFTTFFSNPEKMVNLDTVVIITNPAAAVLPILPVDQQAVKLSGDSVVAHQVVKTSVDPLDELYDQEGKEHAEYSLSSMEDRLLRRKTNLHRACTLLKDSAISSPNSDVYKNEPHKHLIVSREKEVLYCFLPKVANTNFRRVFLGLMGVVPRTHVANVSGYDIYFTYDKTFISLRSFDWRSKNEMLQKYRKFIFVRDPLERLLSGYRNKFFHPNPTHKAEYHNRALEFYRKHQNLQQEHDMRRSFSDKEMTFKEFLIYWTDVYDVKEYHNEHFVPSNQLCDPCGIDFDYIGKYETINAEVRYIFDKLKIDIDFPERNDNYSSVATSTLVKDYYSQIPDWLLKKTWNILKFDYVLFGYRLPDWFYEKIRRG